MAKNKYSLILSHKLIKIMINKTLHLAIKQDELIGIQSWLKGDGSDRKYCIEFTTKTTAMLSEYDSEDKWKSILNLLNKKNLYEF